MACLSPATACSTAAAQPRPECPGLRGDRGRRGAAPATFPASCPVSCAGAPGGVGLQPAEWAQVLGQHPRCRGDPASLLEPKARSPRGGALRAMSSLLRLHTLIPVAHRGRSLSSSRATQAPHLAGRWRVSGPGPVTAAQSQGDQPALCAAHSRSRAVPNRVPWLPGSQHLPRVPSASGTVGAPPVPGSRLGGDTGDAEPRMLLRRLFVLRISVLALIFPCSCFECSFPFLFICTLKLKVKY